MKRRNIGELDKREIGLKCCNCHSTENLEYHHIIPFALGGNDINSNMCCLCYNCHNALHYSDKSYFSKVKLYSEQRPTGRPKISINNISDSFRQDYLLYKQKQITFTEVAKRNGITRKTAYKYKAIIDGENENEQ